MSSAGFFVLGPCRVFLSISGYLLPKDGPSTPYGIWSRILPSEKIVFAGLLFQTLQFQGCLGPYCEMTAEFSIIQTPFCLKWCLLLVWPQFAGVPAHSVGICQSQNSLPFTNNKTLQKVRYKLQKHLQPETPSRFRKSSMMPRIFNWLSDIYTPTCCNPLLGRTTLYLLRWVFRTKGRIQGASRIPARKHGILGSGALKAVHEIESDFLLEGLNPGSLRLVSCSLSWLFSLFVLYLVPTLVPLLYHIDPWIS